MSASPPLSPPSVFDGLQGLLRRLMPEASEEETQLALALSGLMAVVASSDGVLDAGERDELRRVYAKLPGLAPGSTDSLVGFLAENLSGFSRNAVHDYCRILLDHGDRDLRFEALSVLVDLAASDQGLDLGEANLLRRLTSWLGLAQQDYNHLQARYRDQLTLLS